VKRLVTGPRAVAEALRAAPDQVHVIYVARGEDRAAAELSRAAKGRHISVEMRDREALDSLCKGTRHQGVVAVTGAYSYLDLDTLLERCPEAPLLVALDEITDPHNFGAIVRSAVALGADGLITLKQRAAPVTPVVVRASAGATEHARIARVTNLARCLETLAERGMEIVGLDAGGDARITELGPAPRGRVLVVGSEGKGLRRLTRQGCHRIAQIDLQGPIESLNASVAAAIAIHEAVRARALPPTGH